MAVGVEDGLAWVVDGQSLAVNLTKLVVSSATIGSKVGGFVDERSRPGIRTGVGGCPEGVAEEDRSKLVGILSRDASERISRLKRYTHRRKQRRGGRYKCSRR